MTEQELFERVTTVARAIAVVLPVDPEVEARIEALMARQPKDKSKRIVPKKQNW